MKFLKKVLAAVACVCVLATSVTLTSHAAGGRISFADPSTAVGDMVDVKCVLKSSSGSLGSSSVTLSYDASALKFNSGDGVTGGDGTLTYSGDGGSSEVSFTMTFQALKEGSTEITVASQDVKSSSGSEVKLTEGKSTVTIAAGDPSKIVDDTQAAEGADTAASGDVTVEVNGTSYTLSDFVEASVPAGFTKTTMNYEGADRPMAYNETNGVYLAYLTSADGNSNFFLYDDSNATFAPYEEIDISDTTTIVLLSDTSVKLPSNYAQTTLTLNGQEFPVWQDNDKDGFYLMYAVNNNGTKNFYEYDSQENTYQRCDVKQDTGANNAKKKANGFFDKMQNVIDGHFKVFAIIFIVILLLLIIRLIVVRVKLRNRDIELDDLYDEYGIDLEEEELESAPKKKNKKKAQPAPKKGKKKKVVDEDDFDDYDDDDYDGRKGAEEVNPHMNKVMKILMIVVALIIAFILIFAVGKAAGIFKSIGSGTTTEDSSDKDTVKVPDIVGMTEEKATKALKDKKLGIKVDSREDSEKYEEGTVSEQKTKAGTKVKKHSTVHVVVSSALIGKEIIVPDVSGMSEDEAQEKLTDAGFKPTSEFQYDDNVAEGNVISTTPAANSKAAKDTQIKMIVSKGAQKKTVPDVRGKSEADARSEIQAAGLTVGSTSTQHDDSVAKGNVISQSVTPGKKVSAGTAVNLVLSSGSDKVSIQNFAGKDEEELLSWASQNGLNASKQKDEYSSNYEEGTIISMSPASGSVSKGSTITYVLSRGPKPSDNTNTGGNTDNGNSGSGSGSDSGQQ